MITPRSYCTIHQLNDRAMDIAISHSANTVHASVAKRMKKHSDLILLSALSVMFICARLLYSKYINVGVCFSNVHTSRQQRIAQRKCLFAKKLTQRSLAL
jgi:hypothetical protein